MPRLSSGRAGFVAQAGGGVGTVPEVDETLAAGGTLGLVIVVAIGLVGAAFGFMGYLRLRRRDEVRRRL